MRRLVCAISAFLVVTTAVLANAPAPVRHRKGIDEAFLMKMLSMNTLGKDRVTCNRCLEMVADHLREGGVHVAFEKSEAGRLALYASTTPGKGHDYVFLSHVDVVYAPDEQFRPRRVGNRVYARGACDTKGNVAVICEVLRRLAGKASVGAVIVSDEEGGPKDGGTPGPKIMVSRGYVPRKLLLVGDTAGDVDYHLYYGEKGHAGFRMIARGRGGHTSQPWLLDNPIPKLCEGYLKFLRADAARNAGNTNEWRSVITASMLKGGPAKNVVPDEAVMSFSYRFIHKDDPEKMAAFMRETSGLDVEYTVGRCLVLSDPETPAIKRLHEAMLAKFPGRGVTLGCMNAATDATFFAHLGVPTVIFGADSHGAHGGDEWGDVASMGEYADLFTDYLLRESEAR